MNVGVEIALIAVPVPLLAIARDVWLRARVEKREERDRVDRIEKERLDRQQDADIAIVATMPAFLELAESTTVHEAALKLVEEQEKCRELEEKVAHLEETERSHLKTIAAMSQQIFRGGS